MDIGGERLLIRKIGSPHTDDCTAMLCEKERVLFIGDANSEELIEDRWVDNAEGLEALISDLGKMEFDYCLSGHVPLYTKKELMDKLNTRLDAVR